VHAAACAMCILHIATLRKTQREEPHLLDHEGAHSCHVIEQSAAKQNARAVLHYYAIQPLSALRQRSRCPAAGNCGGLVPFGEES